jgi:LEA14-like dessication related protein
MNWKMIFSALLVGSLSLAGCKKLKDPEFRRVENLGVKSLGLANATIGFDVTYYNPNGFGVTVKEAAADIYLDSTYLGKFIQDSSINVASEAEFSIPFSGTISLRTALSLDLESLSRKDVLLKADGSAKVGKAGIYLNTPIHYQGWHRLDEIKLQ